MMIFMTSQKYSLLYKSDCCALGERDASYSVRQKIIHLAWVSSKMLNLGEE